MKKTFCLLFIFMLMIGCADEPKQEIAELPTEIPATVPVEEAVPTPESEDIVVIDIPVTELIVSSEEDLPDLDTLSKMTSLRFIDLTALSNTPYSKIEEIALALPNCRIVWNQLLTDGAFRSDSTSLIIPNATEEDVRMLDVFSQLSSVDASGSTAFDALYAFKTAHPNIAVHYTFDAGNVLITEETDSLTVADGVDYDALVSALKAFPSVLDIDLRECGWSDADISSFVQAFPERRVRRLVRIGESIFDSESEMLDLRSLSGYSADQLIDALSSFKSLKMAALPERMSENEVKHVQAAYPDLKIVGPVSAFGMTFDGGTEEIDLSKVKIKSVEEADALISGLPFLKRAVMCECGLTNEQMETLCSAHPDVKFVWTIVIGKRKLRTDAVGFSTKNPSKYTSSKSSDKYNESVKKAVRLYEGDIEALKYCTDLEALDLGHNYLTNNDLNVIAGLTKLKILILADNKITDISALRTLKDLEYIELFMNKIPDLSPLTEMTSLVDVNVCNTGVSDLTPLFSLRNVKRLWYAMNPFSREQAAELKKSLPDCLCNYTTRDETAEGWREDPRYHWMRSYFN